MKWEKCTEENYPENKDSALIRWRDYSGEEYQCVYSNCPYGWNVLCRLEAEILVADEI